MEYLIENKVDNSNVVVHPNCCTGQAYILSMTADSPHAGDNSIIIVGGANQEYGETIPESWKPVLEQADVLLMQREIPEHINI